MWKAATILAVAASVGLGSDDVGATGPASRPPDRPLTVVFGDSLVVESTPFVTEAAHGLGSDVIVRAWGGTAPCDWLDTARDDAGRRPDVVVVSFVGNALTTCIQDRDGGSPADDVVVRRYRADVAALAATFPDSLVVLVGQPPLAPDHPGRQRPPRLTATYRSIAASACDNVVFVDGATGLVDDAGRYLAASAPRDDTERRQAGTTVPLRSPDGIHFVATDGSSWGARRFARTVADGIDEHLARIHANSDCPPSPGAPARPSGTTTPSAAPIGRR